MFSDFVLSHTPGFFGPPFNYSSYVNVRRNAYGHAEHFSNGSYFADERETQRHELLNATDAARITQPGMPLSGERWVYDEVRRTLQCQARACAAGGDHNGGRIAWLMG